MNTTTKAAVELHINHWTMPGGFKQTMKRADLAAILLKHGAWVFACGEMWDIKSKNLGAGIVEVYLEPRP